MITIDNVRKTFQDLEVLKGVSLSVNEHEIYGIIGQSGAGKSTLLRCINGLESFDSGEILVDNTRLLCKPPGRRQRDTVQKWDLLYQ